MKEIEIKSHDLAEFVSQVSEVVLKGGVVVSAQSIAGWHFATFAIKPAVEVAVDVPVKKAKATAKVAA